MANTKVLTRSFSRGEVTPELFGRVDLDQYQTGLEICRNFITLPHGPAVNRTGTSMVIAVKNSAVKTRLIPFAYNNTQTFAIEVGAGYFRFITQGAILLNGAPAAWNGSGTTNYVVGNLVSYGGSSFYCILANNGVSTSNPTYWYPQPANGALEVPNPYSAADLFDIHYVQSNDTMTLTHPNYPPATLNRLSAVSWSYLPIVFGAGIGVPTGLSATPTSPTSGTPLPYNYEVTAIAATTLEESGVSNNAYTANNLTLSGNYNTLNWTGVAGAIRYNVYKYVNGLYGYIGQTNGTTFVDQNITPDLTQTTPIIDTPFVDNTTYPATVSYYEERKYFGGSNSKPQNFWATQAGTENNLDYSIPSRDDDRLSFKIAARDGNAIRHFCPLSDLILLTAGGEWRINSNGQGAITPDNILITPQSYVGASNVTPCLCNRSIVYAQARGGRIREMLYTWQQNGYISNDLSAISPHLFDYYLISDMAYAKAPYPIVWCVRNDGTLLSLTYLPDQQIAAWHHHDTINGLFESCCIVSENNEDILYVVVNRTLNGVQTRFIERLSSRQAATPSNYFFVDCGATYTAPGAPVTTISGLNWLTGSTVSILADGSVLPQQVVAAGGTITLQQPASVVQVGLPITADIQTLPATLEGVPASGIGSIKNLNRMWLRVQNSGGINAGPSFTTLRPMPTRTSEPYGTPPALQSKMLPEFVLEPSWNLDGCLCIRQTDPLPLTVVSITMELTN